MTRTNSVPNVHFQLYVRSLRHSTATGAEVIDRVCGLTSDSAASFDVFVWGDSAPPSPAAARTSAGRFVLGRIAVFRTWADRNDVSLGPGFEFRTVESGITGEQFEELVLPHVAMAVYRGDDLVCVAPHDGESVLSVGDCLDAVAEQVRESDPSTAVSALASQFEPLEQSRERPPSRTGPRPASGASPDRADRTVSDSDRARVPAGDASDTDTTEKPSEESTDTDDLDNADSALRH